MELGGKVAVITGASTGIGEAVARDLSAAGMKLVLTARRGEVLDRLARELPGDSATLAADIAAPETAPRLLALAQERFGRADILVNNAGLLEVTPVEGADIEKLVQVVRVNFEAVVRACYVFAPVFKAQNSGAIINISSIGAFGVAPMVGVYGGTKAAVEQFTACLRVELAPCGVKVGCIAPGSTRTQMMVDIRGKFGIPEEAPSAAATDIAAGIRYMLDAPGTTNIAGIRIYSATDPM